jgi:hypothetical protein
MTNFLYAILSFITWVLFIAGVPLVMLVFWVLELFGVSQPTRFDDMYGWTVVCGFVTLAVVVGIAWKVVWG